MKERFLQTTASRIQILRVSQQEFSMYQLKLPACPRNLRGISSSLHQCDPCTRTRIGLSLAPRNLGWNIVRSRNETARFSTSGKLLGYGRQERAGVCTGAYREEDWAKLFQPEALKKEDLKQYLNEDPIWLWVFKSWQSGIKGALQFLWTQPGQMKYIEWPSVKSTVKMALLTLVVVMFLMVFLYTVDSLFRHLLKSSMKRIV